MFIRTWRALNAFIVVKFHFVRRYIRLTKLIPELLELVDQKKISFNPAVELSYLTRAEQGRVIIAMDYTQASPSPSQAQRLKKRSQEGGCTLEFLSNLTASFRALYEFCTRLVRRRIERIAVFEERLAFEFECGLETKVQL